MPTGASAQAWGQPGPTSSCCPPWAQPSVSHARCSSDPTEPGTRSQPWELSPGGVGAPRGRAIHVSPIPRLAPLPRLPWLPGVTLHLSGGMPLACGDVPPGRFTARLRDRGTEQACPLSTASWVPRKRQSPLWDSGARFLLKPHLRSASALHFLPGLPSFSANCSHENSHPRLCFWGA